MRAAEPVWILFEFGFQTLKRDLIWLDSRLFTFTEYAPGLLGSGYTMAYMHSLCRAGLGSGSFEGAILTLVVFRCHHVPLIYIYIHTGLHCTSTELSC